MYQKIKNTDVLGERYVQKDDKRRLTKSKGNSFPF